MADQESSRSETTSCTRPDLGDLFIFYINGHVTEERRREIEEHLALCVECREELRFFREAREVERRKISDARGQPE